MLYSYVLVDPNITLINHPLWTTFRNSMVYIGYYKRPLSTFFFVMLIISLGAWNIYAHRLSFRPLHISLLIGLILLFSYPFLSHDFFNYIFDAKILTFYHKNPYLYKALDFPGDPYLRFMHWTHRTYPYGPFWLIISSIPSFLSAHKFLLNFLFLKMTFGALYVISTYILEKSNKKHALFFATNPLVIMEGLVSPHNDLAAVTLGIIFLFFIMAQNKKLLGGVFLLLSILIKYITIFLLGFLIPMKKRIQITTSIFLCGIILLYLIVKNGVFPWYFLNIFVFLPFCGRRTKMALTIFTVILCITYLPFILYGDWTKQTLQFRSQIFWVGVVISIIVLLIVRYLPKRAFFSK